MPELPEVEHLRRTLAPRVIGRDICRVKVHRRDVIRLPETRRQPVRSSLSHLRSRLLEGACVVSLSRHGKQLAVIARGDSPVLLVQLGMSGQLIFVPAGKHHPRADHVHVTWHFDHRRDGDRLIFRDPRRFGGLTPYQSLVALHSTNWSILGRDALTIRWTDLRSKLSTTRRPIKAALLDQQLIAGIGNIYADESLIRAGIHPLRSSAGLTSDETKRLTKCIRDTLRMALVAGGTTLRDYVDGNGRGGRHRTDLLAYSRAGQPCRGCGTTLQHLVVAQRTTTFCPHCQPPRSSTGCPQ